MIEQKKGYPPVDAELSNKLKPPSQLVNYLATKGLKVIHVKRDFYKIGVDFKSDELLQPRNYTDPSRYERLANDYAKGWDHYEFPSVVVVKVKNKNWKLPVQAGGFHSVEGAFPVRGWDHAWTDELEVDSMLDAHELSAILNHPRQSQITANLVTDDVQTVCRAIDDGDLPAFDFSKKNANNLKVISSIGRIAGDKSQKQRETIFKKVRDHCAKTDVTAGQVVMFHMTANCETVNSTYMFSQGKHPFWKGIFIPYQGDAHIGEHKPVFDGMPKGFQDIIGGSYSADRINNAITNGKAALQRHPDKKQFRIYLYVDMTKSSLSLKETRKRAVIKFNKEMKKEFDWASRLYPDAVKVISQDSIIIAGFICQSRDKDPNAKGKYIERTILDPINFKPIDSLTLKPLKEGEY